MITKEIQIFQGGVWHPVTLFKIFSKTACWRVYRSRKIKALRMSVGHSVEIQSGLHYDNWILLSVIECNYKNRVLHTFKCVIETIQ